MQTKILTYAIVLWALGAFHICYSQTVVNGYKDFDAINLDDLNQEGPVGEYMMKAHVNLDIDSTLYFINKAKVLAIKSKDTFLIPYINYHYGYAYYNKQEYAIATTYLDKCVEMGLTYNLAGMLFESYNLLGLINKHQMAFNTSLSYFKNALQFAPTKSDSLNLKINMSTIYIDTNKTDMAKLYLDEVFLAIKKAPNSIEPYWMVFANLNYARTFLDFETKLKYTNNAINNASKTGDAHLLLQSHTALADLYIQFKKYNKALKLCEESLISAHNYNLNDTVIRLYLLLANIYYAQKNYSKSLKYVDSIKASAYPEWIKIHVNELTFNNLYELGDYKNAFLEAKNQAIYIESLLVEKEDKAYAEYAKKYETDKKIQENTLLKKDNQIKNLTISKEKNKRNLFLAIAMVVLLGLIFMYYRYRSKKKSSELLAVKNQTITKQNLALEEANLTKQKFFSIIAHDLINPFNAILGYTSLLENDFNSFSNSEKQEFVSIINKHAIQNYNLVKNLLDWARTQQDRITLNKTKLNIKQTVSHVMEAYNVLASKKHIKTALIIDNNITVYADNNCLKTVLANLYSNAIKFSAEGSTITIKASCNNANSTIAIQDQGIGMTQLQQDNLFCITKTSTTKGTQKEKGTGLGLLISKELIDLHNGTLTVISAPGRGTTISVTLPKK